MITSRKTRWLVALVGALVCLAVYGYVWAQAQEEFRVITSTCTDVYYIWEDIPSEIIPAFAPSGSFLIACSQGSHSGTVYVEHAMGSAWTYTSYIPLAVQFGISGNCHIFASVPYTVPPNPAIQWKYLDANPVWECLHLKLPFMMHYGPRLYQVYDPYPGPMEGMSSQSSFTKLPAARSGNPYP